MNKVLLVIFSIALVVASPPVQMDGVDVLEVLKGFFMGMESSLDVSAIKTCFADLSMTVQDFEVAIQDFERTSVSGVKAGLKDIAIALESIPVALADCKSATVDTVQDIEAGLKAFASPWSLVYHVGKELVVNGREIYHEVYTAIEDWKTEQYYDFGTNIGKAMYQVFLGERPVAVEPGFDDVLLLIGGFLEGMGSDLPPSSIKTCITDDEAMATHIQTAISDFDLKTFDGIKDGLEAVSKAFETLPTAILTCNKAYHDAAEDIKHACEAFKSPWSLAFHVGKAIIVNGKDIFEELSNSMGAWEAQKWTLCGYDLGAAMFKVIDSTVSVEAPDSKAVLELLGGVLEGLAIDLHIDSIQTCISDTEHIALDFKQAMEDFKQENFNGMLHGIEMVAAALKTLPADIKACKQSADGTAGAIEKVLAIFANPISLVWDIGKTLILDGKEIYREIKTAETDWQNKHWSQCGENIGEALFKFL